MNIWGSGAKFSVYRFFLKCSRSARRHSVPISGNFYLANGGSRRNGRKFGLGGRGGGSKCIQVTFASYVFKVMLRSFGAFSIFGNLISRKWMVVRWKFGPGGGGGNLQYGGLSLNIKTKLIKPNQCMNHKILHPTWYFIHQTSGNKYKIIILV